MPITRTDILWCYQTLLGRQPESEAAIASHASHDSFDSLVKSFTDGLEFQLRNTTSNGVSAPHVASYIPFDLPALNIELGASPQDLVRCEQKIKNAWEHLGRERAHFSVLTNDDFLPGNFESASERFWTSGDAEAARAERILAKHGVADLSSLTCVEYGCGVGRITTAFAKRFGNVHAYDISAPHLALARERAQSVGVKNIEFHQSAELPRGELAQCHFFFSMIVFQHNPPPIILELVRRALRALLPGGIAMFQIPTFIAGYHFNLENWLATDHYLDMQMHCIPQSAVFRLIEENDCALLEVREDKAAGDLNTILSNTFVVKRPA
jgi:SAM-dependent methyltransferase